MTGSAKLSTPPARLALDPGKHLEMFDGVLWRVTATSGAHPQAWNELREYGPIPGMRFDPHPPPEGPSPGVGFLYSARKITTALAEVFHHTRVIDRSFRGAALVGWRVTRPLRLLDLTGTWPVENYGAAALQMGEKTHTSEWARAIADQFGDTVDGLSHRSSVDNGHMVTLFARSRRQESFPRRPSFHELLSSAACDELILHACDELNYSAT